MRYFKFLFFSLFLNFFNNANCSDVNEKLMLNKKLILAAQSGDQVLAESCLVLGADIDYKISKDLDPLLNNGATPLMVATDHQKENIVTLLIQKKANVNEQDEAGITALMIATSLKDREIIALLISNGADLNIVDKQGRNVFDFAQDDEDLSNFIKDTFIAYDCKKIFLKKKALQKYKKEQEELEKERQQIMYLFD